MGRLSAAGSEKAWTEGQSILEDQPYMRMRGFTLGMLVLFLESGEITCTSLPEFTAKGRAGEHTDDAYPWRHHRVKVH